MSQMEYKTQMDDIPYEDQTEDRKRAVKIKELLDVEIDIAQKMSKSSSFVELSEPVKTKLEILNELKKLMEGKLKC